MVLPVNVRSVLLDAVQYPAGDIAELYHKRRHIETFSREYKHTLNAQCSHFQMLLCTLTRLAP